MFSLNEISLYKSKIREAINKYGYSPEHNFEWYKSQECEGSKDIFFQSNDGSGLLTIEEASKNKCYIFSSPLADQSRRVFVIVEYLNEIFKSQYNIKKVILELEDSLYRELKKLLPDNLRALSINYTLFWPIYDLNNFDSLLSGKHWKTLRKERNIFYKNNDIKIFNAKEYEDKKGIIKIIDSWKKMRSGKDRVHLHPYYNFVANNFNGADEARVMVVNGNAVGINAGWKIPNSDRFYGAVGIHNYSLANLGDMLYLEDLLYLKEKGYKEVDMGGGEEALTNFKRKFLPKEFYKTHIFSVVKNKYY